MKQIVLTLMAVSAVFSAFSKEITGRVVGENETPLDFANVVLYRDSDYVTGAVTDSEGRFLITRVRDKKCYKKVE